MDRKPKPWEVLVLVRKDSGGVFPDGTTNHPAIDFDASRTIDHLRQTVTAYRPASRTTLMPLLGRYHRTRALEPDDVTFDADPARARHVRAMRRVYESELERARYYFDRHGVPYEKSELAGYGYSDDAARDLDE